MMKGEKLMMKGEKLMMKGEKLMILSTGKNEGSLGFKR